MPAAEFDAWVRSTRNAGKPLDSMNYAVLLQQSVEPRPLHYAAVEADLFERIVGRGLPPGSGPALEHAGAKEK